jgi:hypothetical protein
MKFVPESVTRKIGGAVLTTKANSPQILFAGGLVGVVGGAVLACRATLKVGEVLDEFKSDIEAVKKIREDGQIGPDDEGKSRPVPEDEANKMMAYVYISGTAKLAKLYAPAVAVGAFGVAALTCSHYTLLSRNASLTAAYATLAEAYDAYRERVKKELGEEKEKDLYLGRTLEKFANEETGKIEEHYVVDPNRMSPYSKWFDEGNPNFQKNAEYNRLFIQGVQNYANNILHARGAIMLNEVYDMLGIERTQAGAVVGWVISNDGDNSVDFGMHEARNSDFLNNREPRILLDFNVDGVVFDKIGERT